MKKNILYIILLILGLNLGACSLEEDPKYEYDSKFVFDSEDTANATIMEAYNYLATIYGNHLHYITVANGTMVTRTQPGEYSRAAEYDIDALGYNLAISYQLLYKMIDLSNRIMEGFETSNLSEDSKREGSGQAYFIRGYAYYLLGSLWGRASIHIKPISDESTFFKPLSSRADVYAQAETDLKTAAEKLPIDKPMQVGMANKSTANAYLAKLYFMLASQKQAGLESSHYDTAEELWKKTIEYGNKVDNKTYLDPDYASMFGTTVSTSEEIIFQLNYTLSTNKGVRKDWNRVFAPYWYGVNSEKAQSYRTIVMDRAFYDYQAGTHPGDLRMKTIFLTDFLKGARYDETNRRIASYPFVLYKKIKTEEDKNDPRKKIKTLEKEVLIDGRDFKKPGSDPKNPEYDFSDVENLPKDNNRVNYKEEVYKVWSSMSTEVFQNNLYSFSGKGVDKNSDANYDTNNVILYRNADLLLLLADAYNELGDEAKSNEYINKVLRRAGLPDITSMSKEDRRKFIFFERMFELAGEPILWEDVRRRGTEYLKKIIEIHNNSWFVKYRVKAEKDAIESGKKVSPDFRAIIINNGATDENFLKRNLLLPIPYSEILQNENISQSDQNFGY